MNTNSFEGAQVYTPLSLKLYDWWVLNISNNHAWRCSTKDILLPHLQQNMGPKHLDIGVGTGYYLAKTPQGSQNITLMDLNPHSLDSAKKRIGSERISECILHDVFKPLPAHMHNIFDSISMFYLLHCLPGDMEAKLPTIALVASAIKNDGIICGATILGEGVEHNAFGRKLMGIYNKKGIFNNRRDSLESLREILSMHFKCVDIKLHGTVAVFSAYKKVNQ
ncbi:class I SAM-dependent methyltransferase [Yersinia kristensenii]|uniref:class I SAM-dependent methyltransferase n=1 Tax=Yersinia kristensenii TaxID=28152 RepID=UPI00119CF3C7|nr:class I SAM-dependent methyltransferase [Yersinia kristensenii]MBW5814218.1 class I SAM-dependent methyltransferase [Yersinia kristensenii]MBW5818255.1 class I SAM-dependent methyltransferase [Yersinia kristensenii]MBW5831406.1 class I SAM-dependent methyltransferase [Yersinia kristensenii]MBW5844132.1 class I SAM-dependent methyltransferase [Yersinia kristensenii]MDA5490209.1 class I SAM-dependent methyltransferase [Yersinia kristensenii]